MTKRALILGIGGQDGSYLTEFLLTKNYEVHGLYRRSSVDNLWRVRHLLDKVTLHKGDLGDHGSVHRVIADVLPQELYNLADQDEVRASFDTVGYSLDITAGAVGRILESVRQLHPIDEDDPPHKRIHCRVFQPCSATMFGMTPPPQNEESAHDPRSPYAVAKLAAYHLARFYRVHYGMYVSTGILFNHDSPRRGAGYLLQTICRGAARIALGKQDTLELRGDLNLRVDIGFAGDYVKAMWLSLQQTVSDDYCIATCQSRRISDLAYLALVEAGFTGHENYARMTGDGSSKLVHTPPYLVGSYVKAEQILGWQPIAPVEDLVKSIYAYHYEKESKQ